MAEQAQDAFTGRQVGAGEGEGQHEGERGEAPPRWRKGEGRTARRVRIDRSAKAISEEQVVLVAADGLVGRGGGGGGGASARCGGVHPVDPWPFRLRKYFTVPSRAVHSRPLMKKDTVTFSPGGELVQHGAVVLDELDGHRLVPVADGFQQDRLPLLEGGG